jgi:NADPH-dependent 2,4-dienoyl-CoA reductase/sulfur reductase-like enzyme
VLAAGAREQVIPFPGWTLPGVMTVGAAQLLAKRRRVLPGKRVLIAGSGPLLLAAAATLASHGAQVVAVLEATRPQAWLGHASAAWGQGDRLREGWRHIGALRRGRARYRFGHTVVAAQGDERVHSATVARLDLSGNPLPDGRREIPVDAVCISFSLVPNVELAQLAGAALVFDAARGGWVPQLDVDLQSSVSGLFVAGETAGVAGAAGAMLNGRLAGLAAAERMGRISRAEFECEKINLESARRREARFAATLNTLFAPPPGLAAITTDDTLICRCEEVTAGEARRAIADSGSSVTLDALKIWTRVGQGFCQGRTCGPVLARLIARETGRSSADAGMFSVRPPTRPLPLGALAGLQSEGPGGAL